MNELKYYIKALYLSFFSRQFYSDLIAKKNIFGVRYLILISLIVSVPMALEVKYIISHFFYTEGVTIDESVDHIAKQLPMIELGNGKIKAQAETNQSIYAKTGNLVAIFDVEDKIEDLDGYDEVLIINQEGMRYKLPEDGGVAVLMATDIENALKNYITGEGADKKLDTVKFLSDIKKILKTPLIVILLFATIWFFLTYMASVFALSFIVGIFISFVCKNSAFDFKQCSRVAAFTATPVAFLEMLSNASGGVLFSYVSLVYFVTHILYIHYAIESYKKLKL